MNEQSTITYTAMVLFLLSVMALSFDISDFFIVVDILYQWNVNGFQIGDYVSNNMI